MKISFAMNNICKSIPKGDPQPTMVACPVKKISRMEFYEHWHLFHPILLFIHEFPPECREIKE